MKNRPSFGLVIIVLFVSIRLSSSKSLTAPSRSSEIDQDTDTYDYDDDDYTYEDQILTSNRKSSDSNNNNNNNNNNSISKTTETVPTSSETTLKLLEIPNNNGIDLKLDGPSMEKVTYVCPAECQCSDDTLLIDCSNRSLTQIPNGIPKNVYKLNLSDNFLSKIDVNAFSELTEIREILLTNNQIDFLDNEVFNGLNQLEHLGLSSNRLTNLDPNVFAKSPSLRKICLNFNNLTIPENASVLNQPALQELNLIGCHIEQLYESSFANLTGLLTLRLSKNPLDKDLDVVVFEPIKELTKLSMPKLEQDTIFQLCQVLTAIDLINFESFDVSCFELVSGQTFEESIITVKPITPNPTKRTNEIELPDATDPAPTNEIVASENDANEDERTKSSTEATTNIKSTFQSVQQTRFSNANKAPEIDGNEMNSPTTHNTTSDPNVEQQTGLSSISKDTINKMLIGIIIIAVCGLIVGVICRRDCCGIKTKMCRTRRPLPTDQVRPSEEVPLNKITNNQ